MAEEVKTEAAKPEVKKPKVIDTNSAKYKLGQVIVKHYREVFEAKERGEKIGWCASNFPEEIFETLGLKAAILRIRRQLYRRVVRVQKCVR